jgi:hypothetical protein
VGVVVGAFEGDLVGTFVGPLVGSRRDSVGSREVGGAVGTGVDGVSVGSFGVGNSVGVVVGNFEGALVGIFVGALVGIFVGALVGFVAGASVGRFVSVRVEGFAGVLLGCLLRVVSQQPVLQRRWSGQQMLELMHLPSLHRR